MNSDTCQSGCSSGFRNLSEVGLEGRASEIGTGAHTLRLGVPHHNHETILQNLKSEIDIYIGLYINSSCFVTKVSV